MAARSTDERGSAPGTVRPVADERDGLLSYLAQQRYVLRLADHPWMKPWQPPGQPAPATSADP